MTRTIQLPNSQFLPHVASLIAQGKNVTISVKGYSMRPFLENGRDRVVLSPCGSLSVGDAVLAEISPGHYVLHRIISIEGDKAILQGDGNLAGTERCTMSHVLGVVTQYVYPNHTVMANSRLRRFNIRLWRLLSPLRRYLLFIYRKIFIK